MARTWTESQEAAMNLREKTLLVSAAAGSGKTSVLTERIIRALLDTEHPADLSRMLIVTFTRAAAAELKSRISAALTEALAQNPGSRHLSEQLFRLGSAQISTIDAFFQRAVKENFEALSLPPTFRLADAGELLPLKLELLDATIEEYYQKYAPDTSDESTFSRLHGNPFAEALDNLMSTRSDGKLNATLLQFEARFSSDPIGIRRLKQCADLLRADASKDYFSTVCGTVVKEHLSELFDSFLSYLSTVRAHLDATPDMFLKYSGIVESDTAYCRAMQQALRSEGYEATQALAPTFISGIFPRSKDKTAEILEYQEWRTKFKSEITKKLPTLLSVPASQIPRQMLETAALLEMLYLFYSDYENRLMSEKKERGVFEFDDIRTMLYGLLTDTDGAPSRLAERLASQYDAVYIDEYQDVDLLQDRIFTMIGKQRRFMVGDIKQSIYAFRGSEPSIFAGYRREMPLYTEESAKDADGNCVFMSENFRCNESVIRFANRVCSFLFSACEASVGYRPQDDLVFSKPVPETLPEGHPVPVQFAVFDAPTSKKTESEPEEEPSERDEAIWVAAEISRLLREESLDNGAAITPRDVAILVRTRSHGDAFADELKKLNVPVASASSDELLSDPTLIDLINLLRAIDNPYRDLPLSEFLLSPLGGFTLEELTEIRGDRIGALALYDAMLERSEDGDALAERLKQLLQMLERARKTAAVQPADRFLRLLYLEDFLQPYATTPSLLFLYDQARIYQRTSYCGLYGFLSHVTKLLEEKSISADGFKKAENAVTIMTVHHSKGLEFPVVFLACAGAAFNKDDLKRNLLYHRSVGCGARLFNRETGESEDTVIRQALRLRIDSEQVEEAIRTLYVALTRARERLYVTGTLRGKWESAITSAHLIRRGDRPSILSASNTLLWMLAAIHEKDGEPPVCTLSHVPLGTVEKGAPLPPPEASETAEDGGATASAAYYADIDRRHAQSEYPLKALHTLPAKIAASKLTVDILDRLTDEENDIKAIEAQIELMRTARPSFDALLSRSARASAADVGTATHAFLEYCDFSALREGGVTEEAERLYKMDFISESTRALLSLPQLEAFRASDLMRLIEQAESVRREQHFGLLLPMDVLTERAELADALTDRPVFVQGSIDLLLQMKDGRLILVDYKTDRISDAERADSSLLRERMQRAHGDQLACYARAVKELFGRVPDEIYIYSLPMGGIVPITLEKSRIVQGI